MRGKAWFYFILLLFFGFFLFCKREGDMKRINHDEEERIINERCKKSEGERMLVIRQGLVARTPEKSIGVGAIQGKEIVDDMGVKQEKLAAWLSIWDTGTTSMPGEKEDDVEDITVFTGDEFQAGGRRFKVIDLFEGYEREDYYVRSYICIKEIKTAQ